VTGSVEQIPPGVDSSAYRIVQEALTNSLKHAGPSARARVEIVCGAAGLDVAISDDGRAGDSTPGRGHGLIGIRERVAVVGGDLEAGPGEHGGFVVRARLPYAVEV
jgi:signal transduction histidine kinase